MAPSQDEEILDDLAFKQDIYSYVSNIVEDLIEEDAGTVARELENRHGIEEYPLDTGIQSGPQYMTTSFGLSSMLAEHYEDEDLMFHSMKDGFAQFAEEVSDDQRRHKESYLVQYSRLYSGVAEAEGLQLEYNPEQILLLNLEESRGYVKNMLQSLDEQLQST